MDIGFYMFIGYAVIIISSLVFSAIALARRNYEPLTHMVPLIVFCFLGLSSNYWLAVYTCALWNVYCMDGVIF